MKKMLLIICLAVFGCGMLFSVASAEEETVRIGACHYPPYEFEQPEDGLRGFDVEVAGEAFRRAGITAKFEFYSWARAVGMGKAGELDALLSVDDVPERRDFILLSDPISTYSFGCIVRREYDGPPLTALEDLRGRNIGTMQNYIPARMLQNLGIPHDLSTDDKTGLRKLGDGRIDVLVTSIENTLYLIKKMGMGGRFKWYVYEERKFHLGFSRKRPGAAALAQRFNEGLRAAREDGAYEAIHGKYRPDVIRVAACHYPPFEFETPEDGLRGFDVEVVEEAFRRAGIFAEFRFYPWARVIEMAKDGSAAAILSCFRLPGREAFLQFSEPISRCTQIYLVRKDYDGPELKGPDDLKGMKAGMVKSYSVNDELLRAGIAHDFLLNDRIALKKLADGHLDVLLTTLENAHYLMRTLNLSGHFRWFEIEQTDFHLGFSKDRPETASLLRRFNRGLNAVKQDGVFEGIHRKYRQRR